MATVNLTDGSTIETTGSTSAAVNAIDDAAARGKRFVSLNTTSGDGTASVAVAHVVSVD